MEEIKVGNFIRTKDGVIAKVTYVDVMMVDCDRDVFDLNNLAMVEIPTEYIEEYIVKHAENIIDLIEEGDYVNGKEVKHIAMFEGFPDYPKLIFVDKYRLIPGETAENDEIKSIVTKEQFNQMKYIVGDE